MTPATKTANPDTCEVECPDCEGRGTVPPGGNAPYWDREREECWECSGYGYIEEECEE